VKRFGYTVWGCAVLRNHAHLVLQRQKHDYRVMWRTLAESARQSLGVVAEVPPHHRVWGERPFSRFLYNPAEVKARIDYVNANPAKEALPAQNWGFVVKYPR
jgi:hypothetical protein